MGGLGRHPVDTGKVEAADAAGLMASRTSHVVEPALKACQRADVLKGDPAFACLLQCGDDVNFLEYRISRGTTALHKAESRLQARRHKSYRGRRNRAGGKKF